jgi:hypothetical protein
MLARFNILVFFLLAATVAFYVNFPAQQGRFQTKDYVALQMELEVVQSNLEVAKLDLAAALARSSVARSLSEGSMTLPDKSIVQNIALVTVLDPVLPTLAGPDSGVGKDFDMHIIFYSG